MNRRQLVQATVDYVEEYLDQKLVTTDIAAALHYSQYHLLHEFSQYTKFSLYDYVKKRRLHQAGTLLLVTSASIIDIALETGYQTQQSFSKAFGQIYKTSPKAFRKNNCSFGILEPLTYCDRFTTADASKIVIKEAEEEDKKGILGYMKACQWAFPYLEPQVFHTQIDARISKQEVVIAKMADQIAGVLVFDPEQSNIDGLSSLPILWEYQLEGHMIQYLCRERKLVPELLKTTSFRIGDKLDIGSRARLLTIGFQPNRLLEEFGYPTEEFVFRGQVAIKRQVADSVLTKI